MKTIKFLSMLLFITVAASCGGGGGGNGSPGEGPAEPDITDLPPNEGEVGESTVEFFENSENLLVGLENHFAEIKGSLNAEAREYMEALFEAAHLVLNQSKDATSKVLAGEEVRLPFEWDGDTNTVEEVLISREAIDLLDRSFQYYQNQLGGDATLKHATAGKLVSSALVSPNSVAGFCRSITNDSRVLDPVFDRHVEACIVAASPLIPFLDEVAACGAATSVAITQALYFIGDVLCMYYPQKLQEIEIYPEKPCLRGKDPEMNPGGDTIKVLTEGRFSNGLNTETILKEAVAKGIDLLINRVKSIKSFLSVEAVREYFASKTADALVESGESVFGKDLSKTMPLIEDFSYEIDPSFVEWDVVINHYNADVGTLAPDLFEIEGNQFTSGVVAGAATIQAKMLSWPTSPDQTFESSQRSLRVSTAPYLLSFDMPTSIENPGSLILGPPYPINPDDTDGFFTIHDQDLDFFYMLFFDEEHDVSTAFYGSQLANDVTFNFNQGDILADSELAGNRHISLFVRDTCGNAYYARTGHEVAWPADDLCGPGRIHEICEDEGCIDHFESLCADTFFSEMLTISFSSQEGWSLYDDAVWEEVIHDDGTVGPAARPWIDILKERDEAE